MNSHLSTTPFGRGALKLAHVASQMTAKTRAPEKVVHKWNVFRAICTAKARIGVNERALGVLNALLSFHPETALTGEDLIVFPSNASLALRAHGMAPATLRRHLTALVDCGLIIRRDSPNGKRYARKGRGGGIELAFGFDLGPVVARAEEFEALAEEVKAEERALKLVRERITILRRDIAKMIAAGIEEGLDVAFGSAGPKDWLGVYTLYRSLLARIPRTATACQLEPVAEELSLLAEEILNLLESHVKTSNLSANESQNERHKQNSNPDPHFAFEPATQKDRRRTSELNLQRPITPETSFPLGMVLDACPDIANYARTGIANWRDLLATAAVVRSMLGISPSAWEDAQTTMGEVHAAIVVAAILQKGDVIASAGGYLRDLTERAREGKFSPGPMLMALIGTRKKGMKMRA
jgi:replication initiation protein RepC